jgi:hypothetical protein
MSDKLALAIAGVKARASALNKNMRIPVSMGLAKQRERLAMKRAVYNADKDSNDLQKANETLRRLYAKNR